MKRMEFETLARRNLIADVFTTRARFMSADEIRRVFALKKADIQKAREELHIEANCFGMYHAYQVLLILRAVGARKLPSYYESPITDKELANELWDDWKKEEGDEAAGY